MSTIGTNGLPSCTPIGTAWQRILLAEDIQPGDQPSYQLCKDLFLFHPLCQKIVEMPVKMAQSQQRTISIEDAPGDEVKEEFLKARKIMQADIYVRNVACVKRIYGVGTLVCGTESQDSATPLDVTKVATQRPYFAVMDALNTAGSIVMEQNPNSALFQRVGDITVAGKPWHRSRCCTVFQGMPIYIAYTSSAFGFSGRSVFQSALYPLKSFLQTMMTDDMVSKKAGLLIAFMKGAGSIVNGIQQGVGAIKRWLLKIAQTGEVLQVGHEDRVESVDMQNIDKSMVVARSNIIKNIATAVPMPAQIIEQESFAEGFGEGTEDTKNIVRFVNEIRDELQPLYDFTDAICQRVAWSPEFIATMREKYAVVGGEDTQQTGPYEGKTDDEVFYSWSNKFKATWPNLLEEPESEKAKSEKVKMEGLVAVYEALKDTANDENKSALAEWVQANCNEYRNLFPVPMSIDPAGMAEQPDMDMLEAQSNLAPKPAGKPSLSVAK